MTILKMKSGDKYNHLTAVKSLGKINGRKRTIWKFECECGNICEAAGSDVKQGRKKSCGCKSVEYRKAWGQRLKKILTKPNKMGPINKLYGLYQRAAIRRGYEWNLSVDEFKLLISQNCHYCDAVPATEICIAKEKTDDNTLVYNGIDRTKNSLGYDVNNCRPCCFTCNRMKMDLTPEIFLQTIKKIYEHKHINSQTG